LSFMITPETNYPIDHDTSFGTKSSGYGMPLAAAKLDGPLLPVMRYRTMERWRQFRSSALGRKENVLAVGTAGFCTMTACNWAGLPRRYTAVATLGAMVGTGGALWALG
jgi:hypothetical protein